MSHTPRYRFALPLMVSLIFAVTPITVTHAHDSTEQDSAAKLKAARAKAAAEKAAAAAAVSAGPRTILDGVYTDAQAERGKKLFLEFCSTCHGAKAGGGPAAPSIIGSTMDEREGTTLYDLFSYMQMAMPPDNPGYLRDREYVDVLAYLLQLQGLPAGAAEIPGSEDALRVIEIVARP